MLFPVRLVLKLMNDTCLYNSHFRISTMAELDSDKHVQLGSKPNCHKNSALKTKSIGSEEADSEQKQTVAN